MCLALMTIPLNGTLASEVSKIVIIGDSLTAGYGLEPEEAYPALVQAKIDQHELNYEVVNAGISGDTTAAGLRRIDWVLRGSQAEIVVVALGANDGLRGVPIEQTRENLSAIIDRIRANHADTKILLAGMRMPENMGADFTQRFFANFATVAEEKEVELLPFLLEGVGGLPELNQSDEIHPNAAGQKIMAETVWQHLKPLLTESQQP